MNGKIIAKLEGIYPSEISIPRFLRDYIALENGAEGLVLKLEGYGQTH